VVFSSEIFIFIFLPLTLIAYYVAEKTGSMRFKNIVVGVASIIFYAWGGVRYLILLLILVLVNYVAGILIDSAKNEKTRKLFFVIALVIDIGNLLFFKYLNFFAANVEAFINRFVFPETGGFSLGIPEIVLPIGISFFTFQIMSYVIDLYERKVDVQKSYFRLMIYVMMFPQLIAGPIVRYADVNEGLTNRYTSRKNVEAGLKRFIIGFAKKVFIANAMGSMADCMFGYEFVDNTAYAWLGAISYALQIYYDFSAYSDMAIGLGEIFGFRFLENFNYPYISKSIKEFWRRWHISLSTWFRDYVYIPLGGNRKGEVRTYINLMIVFLLTGFWHGAAWQYIVWGCFHGAFLIIERLGFEKVLKKLPGVVSHIYALVVVICGWVFFRAESVGKALQYLGTMWSFNFDDFKYFGVISKLTHMYVLMFIIAITAAMPVFKKLSLTKLFSNTAVSNILYLLLWIASVVYLSGIGYNPFIYFQF